MKLCKFKRKKYLKTGYGCAKATQHKEEVFCIKAVPNLGYAGYERKQGVRKIQVLCVIKQ